MQEVLNIMECRWPSSAIENAGNGRRPLGFLQQPQYGCQEYEGQKEKQDSTLVMETAREKTRIDINRKQSQGHNSNSVLDDEQREGDQGQGSFLPRGPEKEVAGQQTRDHQGHTRANPAAFLRDHDSDPRQ